MKLICWQCKKTWKRKYDRNPVCCPHCGKDWRKPSFWVRLRAALKAFNVAPYGEPKRRAFKPKQATIDDMLQIAQGLGGQDLTNPRD